MRPNLLRTIICSGILLTGLFLSCKKTEQYAQLVSDQPFLVTSPVGLVPYGLPNYQGYASIYMVGDTAALIGRFFLDKPGSQILVGNEAARILYSRKIKDMIDTINQYTHEPNLLDYVRFLITPSMGTGNRIPVSITCNGVTIQAPPVAIRRYIGSPGKTDTTLFVDSLTKWLPADLSFFQKYRNPLAQDLSVSESGTVCFSNLKGVYLLNGGTITQTIGAGDSFSEITGSFSIKTILSSVLSYSGDSLVFSAEVNENTPDTATAYIYRLCKMALSSKTVTTINRTRMLKGKAALNSDPGLFQGKTAQVPLIATRLKTDMSGSLYFFNAYAPPRTDFDATYYHDFVKDGSGVIKFSVIFAQVLRNICRVDPGGQLTSIFSNTDKRNYGSLLYSIPGYPIPVTNDFMISPDGTRAYVVDKVNMGGAGQLSMGEIDLQGSVLIMSAGFFPLYRYLSYDPSPVTGNPAGTSLRWYFSFDTKFGYFSQYLPLPNGSVLMALGNSIAALSTQNQSGYCYAGTEAGTSGGRVPGQVNSTGKAKFVRFNNYTVTFAGVDKWGAVYYCNQFTDPTNGLTFYRMYPKK